MGLKDILVNLLFRKGSEKDSRILGSKKDSRILGSKKDSRILGSEKDPI